MNKREYHWLARHLPAKPAQDIPFCSIFSFFQYSLIHDLALNAINWNRWLLLVCGKINLCLDLNIGRSVSKTTWTFFWRTDWLTQKRLTNVKLPLTPNWFFFHETKRSNITSVFNQKNSWKCIVEEKNWCGWVCHHFYMIWPQMFLFTYNCTYRNVLTSRPSIDSQFIEISSILPINISIYLVCTYLLFDLVFD